MSSVFGKKKAFLIAQGISIIGYIMLYFLFVPGKPWLYIIALPFFSFGIGSLFTIMMSMTADVIDIDELNTGLRREGIFGAIYWWMVKVGFAIAGALSGIIISYVGFNPELTTVEQQGPVDMLHAFFCFFPVLGTLVAMAVMWNYEISEEKSNEIREQLDKKKAVKNPYLNDASAGLSFHSSSSHLRLVIDKSASEIRNEFSTILNEGIQAICISPYTADQTVGDQLS